MRKRTGSVRDRGTSFQIRYVDADGLRQHESYKTREEAERELAIRLGELAQGFPVSSRPNTVLFGELADDVTTDYEVNGYRSVDDLEARFRLHIIPVFGRRKASQITTAQIRSYTLKRQREGAKPGTINRELEAIRHTFNFALKGRKLLHMPHVPMLREDNVRTGFFTREEVERVASFLPEPLASFVLFGFYTGWRYGEIQPLKWSAVDFARGEIRLDPGSTKNGKGRVFPMTDELRVLLKSIAGETEPAAASPGAPSVLPLRMSADADPVNALLEAGASAVSTPPITKKRIMPVAAVATVNTYVFGGARPIGSFKKRWRTACYKAGIPCTVEPVRKGGIKGAVRVISCARTFHDLRRSAVREWIRNGMPEKTAMLLSGHLTRSVLDRYNIVSEADLRDAVRFLGPTTMRKRDDRRGG